MILQTAIILFAYFTLWYVAGIIIKNASIIDIGWGLGFVLLAVVGFAQNITVASAIVTLLVSIWGIRLAYHIFKRNAGKPEDFRYANFRREWGKTYYIRSFFQLFMFQGLMMFIISLGFLYANKSGETDSIVLFVTGLLVWVLGFAFETIGDMQLKKFKQNKDNKGKIITTGLWKYTRHPNYFGEAVLWWGIFLMAIACKAPWFVIFSPITITLLVRYISGVPMLEKAMEKREGFKEYAQKTNIFVPWIPKGEKNE
ncbi:MAG: DUF1295 domain-containing protein [Eubacteriales bacterium]